MLQWTYTPVVVGAAVLASFAFAKSSSSGSGRITSFPFLDGRFGGGGGAFLSFLGKPVPVDDNLDAPSACPILALSPRTFPP